LNTFVVAVELLPRRERILDGEHRFERLDVDRHGRERRLDALGILVREQEDRLFRVADEIDREQRLIVLDQRHEVLAGNVLVIRDDYAAPVERRIERDLANAAVRDHGAHRPPVEQPGHAQVVEIAGASRDFFGRF
jgi:hypothetical protein